MTQERLEHLMILAVEAERLDDLMVVAVEAERTQRLGLIRVRQLFWNSSERR